MVLLSLRFVKSLASITLLGKWTQKEYFRYFCLFLTLLWYLINSRLEQMILPTVVVIFPYFKRMFGMMTKTNVLLRSTVMHTNKVLLSVIGDTSCPLNHSS